MSHDAIVCSYILLAPKCDYRQGDKRSFVETVSDTSPFNIAKQANQGRRRWNQRFLMKEESRGQKVGATPAIASSV